MLRVFMVGLLLGGMAVRTVVADPVLYQQFQQDRNKQLAQDAAAHVHRGTDGNPQLVAETADDLPKFVRLPDGRIVPYGPGVVCTENCVEAEYIERLPARRNLWVWGIPLIAGGLIAGLIGGGVISGGGPTAAVTATPIPIVSPTPVVTPTPVPPASEVPEPATFALLGAGLTLLARKRFAVRKKEKRQPVSST